MGNRLTIFPQPVIAEHATELLGKEADIVMQNGRTWHAVILQIKHNTLIVRDMLYRKHKIELQEVEEVIFDHPSTF
jgi:hypothetical protein